MLSEITIGDKVDIRLIEDLSGDERRKTYYSQVVNIESATKLIITVPTFGTKLVPLSKDIRVECSYYTSKGIRQGEFVVCDRYKEGNLPVILLEICTPLKKVQRREYFRYDCTLPMKYRIADINEKIPKEKLNDLQWKDGVILDLSGGGMRFVVQEAIPRESCVQFKLVLCINDEYQSFYVYGEIISSKTKENNVRLHECRTQFINIAEPVRDHIISFIFSEQRKKQNMNKGH